MKKSFQVYLCSQPSRAEQSPYSSSQGVNQRGGLGGAIFRINENKSVQQKRNQGLRQFSMVSWDLCA